MSVMVPKLGRDSMRRLLARIGSRQASRDPAPECKDYNWRACHYFNSRQLETLSEFTQRLGESIADCVQKICRCPFEVSLENYEQCYAADVRTLLEERSEGDYHLAFGSVSQEACGLLLLPAATSGAWAHILLGDTETSTETQQEGLSPLEESLLLDMCHTVVQALSASMEAHAFHPAAAVASGEVTSLWEPIEQLFRMVYRLLKSRTQEGDQQSEAPTGAATEFTILLPCRFLADIVGKEVQEDEDAGDQDISKVMLEYIQDYPVQVTAQLGSTILSFEELMSLRTQDVLILDRSIHEPLEVFVAGRKTFKAVPGRKHHNLAALITESCS